MACLHWQLVQLLTPETGVLRHAGIGKRMFLAEWLFYLVERRAPRSHSFSGPCVAPLGPARAPPPVPGARAPKPPKPSFRPSRRPAPSPWGLGAPTSPSERPSEAREPPISPGGPPAAPPAGPFNGHIKRAVGVGRSGRVPLHPWRPGWGGGGRGRAGGGLISLMSRKWVI